MSNRYYIYLPDMLQKFYFRHFGDFIAVFRDFDRILREK